MLNLFPNRDYIQSFMKNRTSRHNLVATPTETHAKTPTWRLVWYRGRRGSGDREVRRPEWMRRSGERSGRFRHVRVWGLTKLSKVLGEDIMSSRGSCLLFDTLQLAGPRARVLTSSPLVW